MNSLDLRRPRLALPFTLLTGPNTVRLVAGEDFRYTFGLPGLERWLPDLLAHCDGRCTLTELLATVTPDLRTAAAELIDRLYGERIVCDGPVEQAHVAAHCQVAPEGTGPLVALLRSQCVDAAVDTSPLAVPILCQDRLDYHAALEFNRRMLAGNVPWLWVTHGPLSRGYVSPLFLPNAGPCLECVVRQFQRLSPAPEIYDELVAHGSAGNAIAPAPFPAPALEILRQITLWKLALIAEPQPPAALYRLHVVEADSLEVSTHRVFVLPHCPHCASR